MSMLVDPYRGEVGVNAGVVSCLILCSAYQAILFSSAFLVKPQGSNSGNSRSLPTKSLEAPSSFMERLVLKMGGY